MAVVFTLVRVQIKPYIDQCFEASDDLEVGYCVLMSLVLRIQHELQDLSVSI